MENEEAVSMEPRRSGGPDQEELLATIRAEVEKMGGERLDRKKFLAATKLTKRDIRRFYPSWNDALKAAGFEFVGYGKRTGDELLLEDWGSVARILQRPPPHSAYDAQGRYSSATLAVRFGSWKNMRRAFLDFAAGREEWADVAAMCAESLAPRQSHYTPRVCTPESWPHVLKRKDRPVCGNPLDLPAMRNAPRNEMGVVLLFGMLAERLGFYVESARTGFPDCEAKRRLGPEEWQTVRIEFEYESRNFRDHGHTPEGCDMIICWTHNWEECPKNLEVIALSDVIKKEAQEEAGRYLIAATVC